MSDLFNREEKVLEQAKAIYRSGSASLEDYRDLADQYKKLLNQSEKLVRIGDSNQNKLIRAQHMMERAMQFHRKKAEKEQQKAKEKSDMVGMITHDMKNKAAPFETLAQMLREEIPEIPDSAIEILDLITAASQRMLFAIDKTLDREASMGGESEIIPIMEWSNVASLAGEALRDMRALADKKKISLEVDIPEKFDAYIDPFLMGEVFENLISNSIKYTAKGGEVKILFEILGNEGCQNYRFRVKDNGVGFDPEEAANLFQSYTKLSSKPTDGESSSGLGLSIVHKIVKLHGGTIHGVSAGKGKGAEFTIELPVSIAKE